MHSQSHNLSELCVYLTDTGLEILLFLWSELKKCGIRNAMTLGSEWMGENEHGEVFK